jgi:hypothetical protein
VRRTLAGLLVGLMLGTTGTIAAAPQSYWRHALPGVYTCTGAGRYAKCRTERYTPRYSVIVAPKAIGLYFNGEGIFYCNTGYRPGRCGDLR